MLYEQISNRFSGFKPFLVHTSRGKTRKRVVKLKEPQKRVKIVKDPDFETFLTTSDNFQFRCIVLLMREGGLRMGEVLGLRRLFRPFFSQWLKMVGTQMINNEMGIADVMAHLDHMSPEMTLRYADIDDDTLKQKFKALVLSGQAVGGAALKALKEQLEKGDESELDWVVSTLRKLSLP